MRYVLSLISILLICGIAATTEPDQKSPPNIIFFLSDDQRFDQMGCAGHPIISTPNMDALAKTGTRFENAFVTTSICAASRATILTGLYERTHGYTFGTIPIRKKHSDVSYPVLLRKAGYQTGFIGKFGVSVQKGAQQQMFNYFKPLNRNPYFKKQKDGTKRHITQMCGDFALEFIQQQKKTQPFCLSISFNAPHAEDSDKKDHYPYPEVVKDLYKDVDVPAPRLNDPKIYESQPDLLKKSLNRVRYFWRWDTPEKYQRNVKGYWRMISGVDHVIGRVREELKKQNLDKNTVIVFCADNGYYMANRGFAGKWSHYEDSLRIPMIIHDPRLPKTNQGQVSKFMTLNLDVPATILDYAGVKQPKTYQGRSLRTLVEGNTPTEWRTDFFVEHLMHAPVRLPKWEGVRDQRWVYARYFEQNPAFEFLHDLKTDPDQLKNLATDPKYKEQLEKMRKRSLELRESYGGEYTREKFPRRGDRQK